MVVSDRREREDERSGSWRAVSEGWSLATNEHKRVLGLSLEAGVCVPKVMSLRLGRTVNISFMSLDGR
jgi:hypothetical protein